MEGRILACSFQEGGLKGALGQQLVPFHIPVPCRSPSGGRAGCFTSRRRAAGGNFTLTCRAEAWPPARSAGARAPGSAQRWPVEQ